MERLYGIPESRERYGIAERTARELMRDEIGLVRAHPPKVTESALARYEERQQEKLRRRDSEDARKKSRGRKAAGALPFPAVKQGPLKPGQLISRVRPQIKEAR